MWYSCPTAASTAHHARFLRASKRQVGKKARHPERSEGSPCFLKQQILRYAQNDRLDRQAVILSEALAVKPVILSEAKDLRAS
jgi:hypothetical protein